MSWFRKDSSPPSEQRRQADAEGWESWERLSKSQAELLLDWLEANGYLQRELSSTDDGRFTVRWRR